MGIRSAYLNHAPNCWHAIWSFEDEAKIPPAPEGKRIEVERDCFFGLVMAWRYVDAEVPA